MSFFKVCPGCERKSYSIEKKKWQCPHCGKDLTNNKIYSIGEEKEQDANWRENKA